MGLKIIPRLHRRPCGRCTGRLAIWSWIQPEGLAETRGILTFIAKELSLDTYVNLMPQYRPCGQASQFPELSRRLSAREFKTAVAVAMEAGLRRLD